MNDDTTRLVEQARELLAAFGDVRLFDVLVPTALLSGLADAVERLQAERDRRRALLTEIVAANDEVDAANNRLADQLHVAQARVDELEAGIREHQRWRGLRDHVEGRANRDLWDLLEANDGR
jgi:hypothetical protein